MTIEGVTGYGYSSQGNVGQDNAPRGAKTDAGRGAHGGAQAGAQADDHAEDVAVEFGPCQASRPQPPIA